MITQLENELANERRRRHAKRIDYATANLVRLCGIKIKFARPKRVHCNKASRFRIEGIDGELVGNEELRSKLYELGYPLSPAGINSCLYRNPARFGDYIVHRVEAGEAA